MNTDSEGGFMDTEDNSDTPIYDGLVVDSAFWRIAAGLGPMEWGGGDG